MHMRPPTQPPQWAWTALACVYVIGATLSFGHASNYWKVETFTRTDGTTVPLNEARDLKIVFSGILWPFYVAHLAFRPATAAVETP